MILVIAEALTVQPPKARVWNVKQIWKRQRPLKGDGSFVGKGHLSFGASEL